MDAFYFVHDFLVGGLGRSKDAKHIKNAPKKSSLQGVSDSRQEQSVDPLNKLCAGLGKLSLRATYQDTTKDGRSGREYFAEGARNSLHALFCQLVDNILSRFDHLADGIRNKARIVEIACESLGIIGLCWGRLKQPAPCGCGEASSAAEEVPNLEPARAGG
jgi:hypothetical protein